MNANMLKPYPISKVFHLVEPSPVVLVSTADQGVDNVMTMSWYMMMEANPPLIGCGIGPWNYSFAALMRHRECVISIPTESMMRTVIRIGNISGDGVDKFTKFGLTKQTAAVVDAPLITECRANLECQVVSLALVKKYNVFVVKVVRAWAHANYAHMKTFHANGDGTFVVDGRTVNLKQDMVKWKGFIR